ncbi:hypothetical protein [Carboxylicivirga marina]|uniref:hypothetical protein n=1 Tax=Carboxylicivirga marina TaxID=2800988 RepID=UPI002591A0AC|nr:hypothetical protein [uncultured Carboxylicivirga sp.]
MLSQIHKKGLLINEVVDTLTVTGESVLKEQQGIARTYYNRRSGALLRGLKSSALRVINRNVNPTLVIDYPKHIRFLDMQLTGKGVPKENHHPIYNKPLYGFIFGYAYKRLRYGLAASMRQSFIPDSYKSRSKVISSDFADLETTTHTSLTLEV